MYTGKSAVCVYVCIPLGMDSAQQYWRRSGNEPQLQVIGKKKKKMKGKKRRIRKSEKRWPVGSNTQTKE